ncbi:MAG: hypothetical protein Q8L48_09455 [Archangium sp.]|nr:hypothetical protein [Archangium sp.]
MTVGVRPFPSLEPARYGQHMVRRRTTRRAKNEEELPIFSSSIRVLRTASGRVTRVADDQTADATKLMRALGKPGVARDSLFSSAETPIFRAHPARPDLLIRSFRSGKEEAGRIDARGTFRIIKAPIK